jgi:hypothetical protein
LIRLSERAVVAAPGAALVSQPGGEGTMVSIRFVVDDQAAIAAAAVGLRQNRPPGQGSV